MILEHQVGLRRILVKGHLMIKFKQLFQNYYEIDDNNTKYQMSNRQMMMVLEDFKKYSIPTNINLIHNTKN